MALNVFDTRSRCGATRQMAGYLIFGTLSRDSMASFGI